MNPYPFALLNHFTTPFILSTKCPFSARPLSRGKDVPAIFGCILERESSAVKGGRQSAAQAVWRQITCNKIDVIRNQYIVDNNRLITHGRHPHIPKPLRRTRSSHNTAEIVLASRMVPFIIIFTTVGSGTRRFWITSSSSGSASPARRPVAR